MNNSIQVSSSASADVQKLNTSSLESSDNAASNDDSTGFSLALASAESETGEQNLDGSTSDTVSEEYIVDGNSLPAEDNTAMWQALLLLQPAESSTKNSSLPQLQGVNILDNKAKPVIKPEILGQLSDSKGKPVINSEVLNQDYFNLMSMQSKGTSSSLPAGFNANNISMQLAAAQFIPATNEAATLTTTEQLQPVPGISSTLSQSLAAVGLGTATQAASTQTQMAPLNLGQNAWESNLGSRLQMMVGKNVQTAEIRLDPPELGALDIKIKITNDVASVNITSANAQVREALETAVPKLREMFEENGVSLGDVNVRQESFAEQQNSDEGGGSDFSHTGESDFGEEPVSVTREIVSNSLLDIYA